MCILIHIDSQPGFSKNKNSKKTSVFFTEKQKGADMWSLGVVLYVLLATWSGKIDRCHATPPGVREGGGTLGKP